jgi:hypothetical protein
MRGPFVSRLFCTLLVTISLAAGNPLWHLPRRPQRVQLTECPRSPIRALDRQPAASYTTRRHYSARTEF